MAVGKRRDIVASRRRTADEGEEDEVDSLDGMSQSDPSVFSGPNESLEENASENSRSNQNGGIAPSGPHATRAPSSNGLKAAMTNAKPSSKAFAHTADTDAMVNGLKPSVDDVTEQAMQYEELDSPDAHPPPVIANGALPTNAVHAAKRENYKGFVNRGKDQRASQLNTTVLVDNSRPPRRKGRESSGLAVSAR